jgi:hypothetical protein
VIHLVLILESSWLRPEHPERRLPEPLEHRWPGSLSSSHLIMPSPAQLHPASSRLTTPTVSELTRCTQIGPFRFLRSEVRQVVARFA